MTISVKDESAEGSITITADYLPNIILQKQADKRYVLSSQEITYTINYGNIGQGTATDVNIIEVLPKNTELSTVNSPQSTVNYWYGNKWQPAFNSSAIKIRWLIPQVAPDTSYQVAI